MQIRPTENAVVKFDRIGMRYGRGPDVLTDIDLELYPGSYTYLTGPSGAGKSTLLKLIYMDLQPSRGLITLFGQDTATLDTQEKQTLKRRVGVVLQDFRLIDHLSVFENVSLPLRVAGMAREAYRDDIIELLRWVGLGHRMQALPPTLSGGEKQRAAIARSVIAKPDILIADEPTGNVDALIGGRLIKLFNQLNLLGTTVIIATHDLDLIRDSDADVLRLDSGHLFRGLDDDDA